MPAREHGQVAAPPAVLARWRTAAARQARLLVRRARWVPAPLWALSLGPCVLYAMRRLTFFAALYSELYSGATWRSSDTSSSRSGAACSERRRGGQRRHPVWLAAWLAAASSLVGTGHHLGDQSLHALLQASHLALGSIRRRLERGDVRSQLAAAPLHRLRGQLQALPLDGELRNLLRAEGGGCGGAWQDMRWSGARENGAGCARRLLGTVLPHGCGDLDTRRKDCDAGGSGASPLPGCTAHLAQRLALAALARLPVGVKRLQLLDHGAQALQLAS